MAQPYVGEIQMFAGNFAPAGWMFCEGQLLPISEYETLFNLIGTSYGGDGQSTFALPDLRGRIPLHQGNGFILGETGGAETITLTTAMIPNHTHQLMGSRDSGNSANGGQFLASGQEALVYATGVEPDLHSAPASVSASGGSQPHENFMPYLCVDFIISLFGIFPSPT
jgi:microcystin-dependent protein